ncbi:MAG: cobalamin-dependent protein, partial [Treponema sp.]|nr:cobalamin-dependent protein [Treponema sp.]
MAHRHSWVVRNLMKEILLTTINAKWIHPSLALRLLKANLGSLKDRCEILEFALRQPLREKTEPIIAARPRILGISVSIWNHTAVIELLKELEKTWTASQVQKPVIVLGGPEVSHLPPKAEIFNFADYVVTGEGETAFKALCENILLCGNNILRNGDFSGDTQKFVVGKPVNLCDIKTAYHLYTDEDLAKKLIYAESSRGCPFNCDFCLSSISDNKVREFPLEQFLKEMDILINRGAKTLKFLDRTFNSNIKRAIQICEFFLDKIDERRSAG